VDQAGDEAGFERAQSQPRARVALKSAASFDATIEVVGDVKSGFHALQVAVLLNEQSPLRNRHLDGLGSLCGSECNSVMVVAGRLVSQSVPFGTGHHLQRLAERHFRQGHQRHRSHHRSPERSFLVSHSRLHRRRLFHRPRWSQSQAVGLMLTLKHCHILYPPPPTVAPSLSPSRSKAD
jgi:hypothetical protein